MNTYKKSIFLSIMSCVMLMTSTSHAQVVVNDKNLNDDKNLHYIQLMYYIDKSTLRPVFFVDDGFIEPEYNDILEPEKNNKHQKIIINGEALRDRVTVVGVLNRMHQAGWEYMGDVVFVPLKMMDNWHVMTLRRSANPPATDL